ncbi:class I SAM-dependent methyltransferase [Methanonatronarchaeum sp. AMET-Sl]|uniref:class I SAM-dependent methyltransferase n=1 Tax=Methanonatronarchaeum sp. AMET-Sl TaxID=3037654 RepID=UPI00244DADC3|nr:class I SAM-dependent methyltransferase [Methanonatronarchaeum sp. AMET-Sl]WGI17640.1 class I SAM-dependent methyltransferase [Methanonatronarchaeum sp. AMET-Sl]
MFDVVIGAGVVEHIPEDKRINFFTEVDRCLNNDGALYLTAPVEVGFSGLIRFLAKNFVYPNRGGTPNGVSRYFDYSLEEFLKTVPRNKHGTGHRYYNYTYTINELKSIFDNVSIYGWPVKKLKQLNPLLFIQAKNNK